jgi:hypothetical protein
MKRLAAIPDRRRDRGCEAGGDRFLSVSSQISQAANAMTVTMASVTMKGEENPLFDLRTAGQEIRRSVNQT